MWRVTFPFAGDLYIFRGRRAILPRFFGMMASEFIWPSASSGAVSISAAQMAYMLDDSF